MGSDILVSRELVQDLLDLWDTHELNLHPSSTKKSWDRLEAIIEALRRARRGTIPIRE